jgi:hypothetical protein
MFLILFLGFLSCALSAFAHAKSDSSFYGTRMEQSDIPQQSSVYVNPEQIYVNAEGIFIEISGNLYQVSQICQDESGFFVPRVDFWWRCVNGHPNPPWRLTCQVCGRGPTG